MSRDTVKMQHDAKKNEEPTVDGWPLHSGLPKPMSDKELLQQALNALELDSYYGTGKKGAIQAIKARLAQPEPEPVAYGVLDENGQIDWTADYPFSNEPGWPDSVPLYTAPPQRQSTDAVSEQYAHRLAIMLECMVLSPNKTWNEANDLISEYHEALQRERINAGEPYVSGFGKD